MPTATITAVTAIIIAGLAGGGGQARGFLLEIIGQAQRHQLDPGEAFDVAQIGLFIGRDKADRNTIGPGAGGAANAVHILFRHIGHFIVINVGNA